METSFLFECFTGIKFIAMERWIYSLAYLLNEDLNWDLVI